METQNERYEVGFTYWMTRASGKETAESFFRLPVSKERYAQFLEHCDKIESSVYKEVQGALENLARLQGYKLTGFKPEFSTKEADSDG